MAVLMGKYQVLLNDIFSVLNYELLLWPFWKESNQWPCFFIICNVSNWLVRKWEEIQLVGREEQTFPAYFQPF